MADEPQASGEPDGPGTDIKPKDWQKRIWLLTYCPAGKYLTPDMLKEHGLIADECHSTADRVMNFTYIHLTKKVTRSRLENFMKKVEISEKIVKNEIFGYDPIGSNSKDPQSSSIERHIVFQMLLKHCNENQPSFQPNTDGEPVLKRGHLFQALDIVKGRKMDLEYHTKKQLIAYAKLLEEQLEESKKKDIEIRDLTAVYVRVLGERSDLTVENSALKRKIHQLEGN